MARRICGLALLALGAAAAAAGQPPELGGDSVIYVIRHGEKDPSGRELSAAGWRRARGIAQLWGGGPGSRFPAPRALFANLVGSLNSLQVDSSHNRHHNKRAAKAIAGELARRGGPILVAWEHKNIGKLARHLLPCRGREIPEGWGSAEFDRIFVLRYSQDATCESFAIDWEHLSDNGVAGNPRIMVE
mmetsp:Transcript_73248/g.192023  ORF Transcript_73248/g.192023 Transcript_73248/m.192023 type:complete len:188 (-) Transcript_73248:344-907(-)